MAHIIYTADQVAELTTLAAEARELDAEWRKLNAEIGAIVTAIVGEQYLGWETDYPELTAMMGGEFTPAPFAYIPRVGEFATSNRYNAAEWRKLNNKCRREIADTRTAIAAHAMEVA